MLLVPLNTDAPIYHFPWATIGLIIINVLMFGLTIFLVGSGSTEIVEFLILEFDTINPLQWLTNNFMHNGIFHLIGNMFFLWGFGLVVEGKLGWKWFLLTYLGIGIVYGAIVQTSMFMLSGESGALGASAAIYGLMGIAVIWAPKNDLNCFLWAGIFSRMIELPIVVFGGIYIGLQIVFLAMQGFQMSSEMLHIAGLAVGIPIGIVLLKKDLVDCEGWDYFTVYFANADERKERQTRRRRERSAAKTTLVRNETKERLAHLDNSLQDALIAGNDRVVCTLYEKYSPDFLQGARLSDAHCLKLVSTLQREQQWAASIPIVVQLLGKHPPEKTTAIRLNLAKTLIAKTDQPRQGLAVLKKISMDQLAEKQKTLVGKLVRLAKQKQSEGAVEFDIHDW